MDVCDPLQYVHIYRTALALDDEVLRKAELDHSLENVDVLYADRLDCTKDRIHSKMALVLVRAANGNNDRGNVPDADQTHDILATNGNHESQVQTYHSYTN